MLSAACCCCCCNRDCGFVLCNCNCSCHCICCCCCCSLALPLFFLLPWPRSICSVCGARSPTHTRTLTLSLVLSWRTPACVLSLALNPQATQLNQNSTQLVLLLLSSTQLKTHLKPACLSAATLRCCCRCCCYRNFCCCCCCWKRLSH